MSVSRPGRTTVLVGLVTTLAALLLLGGPLPGSYAAAKKAPATPTGLAAVAGATTQTTIIVGWHWSSAPSRYRLQLSGSRAFTRPTTVSVARTTKPVRVQGHKTQRRSFTSLSAGRTYYVRIKAVRGGRSSAWSKVVTVRTAPEPAPTKPATPTPTSPTPTTPVPSDPTPTTPTPTPTPTPSAITGVTGEPGPEPGELTISWVTEGRHVDHFRIDTGLTIFSRTDPTYPVKGRNARSFVAAGDARSLTLTAAQTAEAGAPLGSANHLYYRVYAVATGGTGPVERAYPYLRSSDVAPLAPNADDVPVRVANYNVRTATAGDAAPNDWASRAPYVAKTIVANAPGLVSLQELSPGPMDGATSTTRQTDSLLAAVHAAGGTRYALVRTTSYYRGGTVIGSQGTRILYDEDRYALVSPCEQTTTFSVPSGSGTRWATQEFSDSCSFLIPIRPGDSEKERRSVAYAEFRDRATGARFWFVSAHLDYRTSNDPTENQSLDALRGQQADTIMTTMDALNTDGLPIILGADLNTYQNTPTDYAAHNRLIANGYYDTAAAVSRINFGYSTMNKFAARQLPSSSGFGARLDKILVKGATGSSRFEIVVDQSGHPASDHNMVVADFRLPIIP